MNENYFTPALDSLCTHNSQSQIQHASYNDDLHHAHFFQSSAFQPHNEMMGAQSLKNTYLCSGHIDLPKYPAPVINKSLNAAVTSDTMNKSDLKPRNKTSVFKPAEMISYDEHQESIKNSPAYFLGLFLDVEVINWFITEASNNGREQKNFIPPTEEEMRCFIAILYLSGYLDVPRRRMLWERSPDTHCLLISSAMQRDRFESIFTSLYAGDNIKDDVEYLNCIRSLMDLLNPRFFKNCPVDDQHSLAEVTLSPMVRHHNAKNPKKTVKVWCGCIKTGYCLYFVPSLGSNGKFNVVSTGQSIVMHYVRLLRCFNPLSCALILERIYCDHRLVDELQKMGVQTIGVDREKTNCFLNPALGGVDRLESILNLYRTSFKGRKSYSTLLNFCLDLAMNNAWHLYKTTVQEDRKPLDLLGFRRNIVIYYLEHYAKSIPGHKGGRPSKVKLKGKRHPPSDARFDGIRHYVIPQEKQTRCGRCTAKTTTRCQKCDVGVHVKCFVEFHTRTKER